jgi:hypothetical protein
VKAGRAQIRAGDYRPPKSSPRLGNDPPAGNESIPNSLIAYRIDETLCVKEIGELGK